MEYILGVDGGATKTSCVIADSKGQVIVRGEGGPSNYHVVRIKGAKASISEAVNNALSSAGLKLTESKFRITCFGMAGLDSPKDAETITHFIEDLGLAEKNIVVHDSLIALYGTTLGRPGIILIAGTGSVAAGKNEEGTIARAGNWGHIIGDEGSAYDIGRGAIVSAIRAYDGRGPSTLLTKYVKRHLDLSIMEDIMDRVYVKRINVAEIASLAPLVVKAAKEGDKIALNILNSAAKELALAATAVIIKLRMEKDDFDVGTIGGVFKAGNLILEPVKNEILKVAPKARITTPKFEPVIGAVILALERLGVKINEKMLEEK